MTVQFISGHGDVTAPEFFEHYVPLIDKAVKNGDSFVVGDFHGVDMKAQTYLFFLEYRDVKVYHMFIKPRYNCGGFKAVGGFTSDEDRDSAMTRDSDVDIAWVRKGKETSCTQQNIDRRKRNSS